MTRLRAPWWMFATAACFVGCAVVGVTIWVRGPEPPFIFHRFDQHSMIIEEIRSGSSAERAGLQAGDRVVSFDGLTPRGTADWDLLSLGLELNHPYTVDVERLGRYQFVLLLEPRSLQRWPVIDRVIAVVNNADGVVFLLLATVIAFGRPRDPTARLGALILALFGIELIVPLTGSGPAFRRLPPIIGPLVWWPSMGPFLVPPLLFVFSATFPRPLLRVWWAWVVTLAPTALFVVLAIPNFFIATFIGVRTISIAYLDPELVPRIGATILVSYIAAALIALVMNYRRLGVNDRRRVRVLVVGTVIGSAGYAALTAAWLFALTVGLGTAALSHLFVQGQLAQAVLLPALPASWSYAILRHRLFDIRVIVRQGLQYALARRVLVTAVPVLGLILVVDLLLHAQEPLVDILRARGWAYIAVGGLAVVTNLNRDRWLAALDRRFFRDRYDAQTLLRDVVEQIRLAHGFEQSAPEVVRQIEAALHARFVTLLTRESHDAHYRCIAIVPGGHAIPVFAADSKFVALIRLLGKPLEVPQESSGGLGEQLPPEELAALRQADIELIVPVVTDDAASREVILVLGPKRSEEPYARADRDLLVTIATSLALLLDRSAPTAARGDAFEECPVCGTCYDCDVMHCTTDGTRLATVHLPRRLAARYVLERRLGRGGMGTVYAASDSALSRRVAVKVVREELVTSEIAAERFRREARAAAGFTHPNVVTIHDFGLSGSRGFLVMELLEGETLREAQRRRPRFDARRTLDVLSGLCAAIAAAHRRQLVHGDLKPENVLLTRGESGETVKVLDFGLAKFTAAATEQLTRQTAPGVVAGTPPYMSPEQWLGEGVQPSWDLWALGVMAYEMIGGAHPFDGDRAADLPRAVLAGRCTPLSVYLPSTTPSLEAFFERALSNDSRRRAQSADLFYSELASLLS